ncbi:hypothetical protein GCM10020295_02990 [Streptomyces cinereospinus]
MTEVPPLRPGARTLLVCLPSTWPLLRRLLTPLGALPRAVALHSTAAAPEAAKEVVHALRGTGFTAHALLGSTETGAVAHRPIAPAGTDDGPWRLLPDVVLVPDLRAARTADPVQPLHVISPRLGRRHDMAEPPASWRTTDLVRRRGLREFDHLGRSSRLVKANGVRVWLDEVESAVAEALPGLDVACLPVPDGVRGEHYEMYCAPPAARGHGPRGTPHGPRCAGPSPARRARPESRAPGGPDPALAARQGAHPGAARPRVRQDRLNPTAEHAFLVVPAL